MEIVEESKISGSLYILWKLSATLRWVKIVSLQIHPSYVDGSWDLGKGCRSWVGGTEDKGEHFMVNCRSGEGGQVEERVTIVTDAR